MAKAPGRAARRGCRSARRRPGSSRWRRARRPSCVEQCRTKPRQRGSQARSTTTAGTPTTLALVRSSQACGTWSALICLPPAQRLVSPRKTVSVPSVTTIDGTRPIVTTSPLSRPQASPTAGERDDPPADRRARDGVHEGRPSRRRQADHRGDRQVDVAGEHHQHLRRSATIISSAASIASAVRLAPLSMRGLTSDDRQRPPPRSRRARPSSRRATRRAQRRPAGARLSRGCGWRRPGVRRGRIGRCAGRRRSRRGSRAPGRRRRPRSSAVTRPSRSTTMRSHMPISSGSSDEIRMIARPWRGEFGDHRVDLGLGLHVDALGRLVEDQQRAAWSPAIWTARPSAGCRRTAS